MPRPPRIHVAGALYYVAQEAEQGKQLFKDREDCGVYLNLLSEYKEKYNFKLHSFCLLPNNIHLVLEPSEQGTISNIMRDLTSRYTKHFNGRYETLGSLFHSRFKAVVIEKDNYLLSSLTIFLGTMTERLEMSHLENVISYPSNQSSVTNGDSIPVNIKNLIDSESNQIWTRFSENPIKSNDQNAMIAHLENGLKRSVMGSQEFMARVNSELNQIPQETIQKTIENADSLEQHKGIILSAHFHKVLLAVILIVAIPVVNFAIKSSGALSRSREDLRISSTAEQKASAEVEAIVKKEIQKPEKAKKELVVVLNGTRWNVQLVPMEGGESKSVEFDHLLFDGNQVVVEGLKEKGFDPSHYTMTVTSEGVIIWETIQRNKVGEIISWRGEWNGEKMTGIISKQLPDGKTQAFNFIGAMQSPVTTVGHL